ncbi:hypothetical protein B0T25DRAFT_255965 [Lasiosphaeria hispida]|uniref:Nucleic acid-binding protein n=1 Tax=Lasiosphaeria hispida TaxID=260671 RepID=A0AAJ0HFQ7_9PEZI|nr:hypothetical protein B0T25DRAFT_255965 [Lasiosphaeria hispida]
MANKVLIYTGAPDSRVLDWSSEGLLADFQEPIARFVGVGQTGLQDDQRPAAANPGSVPDHAAWRSLPLEKTRIPTGDTQQHTALSFENHAPRSPGTAEFFTTASVSFGTSMGNGTDENEVLSQLYEASLANQDPDQATSQLTNITPNTSLISTTTTSFSSDGNHNNTTSFASNNDPEAQPGTTAKEPLHFRGAGAHLSDLNDIPSASYLLRIQPQTMTCNLIVGVISVSAPRTYTTRYGPRRLVEVLVGDETRAGFAVTIWLPPENTSDKSGGGTAEAAGFAAVLRWLRGGDVVLLLNVALKEFRKKVYGETLPRNLSRAYLLHRARLDEEDVAGHYSSADLAAKAGHPQLEKTRRVRDWVVRFVGRGQGPEAGLETSKRGRKRKAGGVREWDTMPPVDDTQ